MKLSATLQAILANHVNQPLKISTLLEYTGEQGFGAILGFLTLPMVIPIPIPLAGLSTLMGAGVILMGVQFALGSQKPRLPSRISRIQLQPSVSQGLLQNLNRVLRPLERLAKPRLTSIPRKLVHRRLIGLCLIWNAILMGLPLPIPFTNIVPGYAILILAIGILEEDGLMILAGYGSTAATTVFFISLAGAIWALLVSLIHQLPWF
jgi:hypothetical protein